MVNGIAVKNAPSLEDDTGTITVMKSVPKKSTLPVMKSVPNQSTLPVMKSVPKQSTLPVMKSVPNQSTLPVMKSVPKQTMLPMEMLKSYYFKHFTVLGLTIKEGFKSSLVSYVSDDGRSYQVWHSVFTCPRTGTLFPSGKLLCSINALDQVPPGGTVGYHYYHKRKEAEQAAAARAVDALGISSPQLCVYNDADPFVPSPSIPMHLHTSPAKEESSAVANIQKDVDSPPAPALPAVHPKKGVLEEEKLFDPEYFYMQEFQMQIAPENYESERVQGKITGWTSIFICPFSGTKYPSKTVSTLEVVPMNESRVFYRTRREAEQAAGDWAVDVLRYQTRGILVPRHCKEDPSEFFQSHHVANKTSAAAKMAPVIKIVIPTREIPKDVKSAVRLSERETPSPKIKSPTNVMSHVSVEKSQKVLLPESVTKASTDRLKEKENKPVGLLSNFLKALGQDEKSMSATTVNEKVSAPVVSTQMDEFPKECVFDSGSNPKDVTSDEAKRDGVVLIPSFSTVSPSDQFLAVTDDRVYSMEEEDGIVSILPSSFGASPADSLLEASSADFGQIDLPSEFDKEEDGVVSVIPSTFGESPAQRLLSASFKDVYRADSESNLLRNVSAQKRMDVVLQAAEAWLSSNILSEEVVDSPHRLSLPRKDSAKTLFVAKAILSALANVAQATPIGTSTPIENVAKRMIDSLWKTEKSFPDADSYTFFLKCISGTNPVLAVEIAEAIVDAMLRGATHKTNVGVLPKPNQGTFNALIQITAQIGGKSGRYPKHTDGDVDFTPDRESFLGILSSCIYSPAMELEYGGFDRAFVEECIARMSQLGTIVGNHSLTPDTTVYNAPLRWTGGPVLWMESRPYARFVNWDNYEQLYGKGKNLRESLDEEHHFVKQARAMESWLEAMKAASATNPRISPNIETYEAVMQGWLRTSSVEGLDLAQDLLQKLLENANGDVSLKPRLQTFHPIIAALYHSRREHSSAKILKWIEQWEKFSLDSETSYDPRLIDMKLATSLQMQGDLLSKEGIKSKLSHDKRRAEILTNAKNCSEIVDTACHHLERIVARGPLESQPLHVDYFLQATRAWENVATFGAEIKDPQLSREALSEMMRLFGCFEAAVNLCVQNAAGVSLKENELNAQLEHIVTTSHVFFCRLVMQLAALHEPSNRTQILLLMEKMTRAIGEFAELEDFCVFPLEKSTSSMQPKPDLAKRLAGTLSQPDDLFDYQIQKENSLSSSRFAFLWQVVKFLDELSKEDAKEHLSDILRIILLVKEIGSSRRRSTKMIETSDKILHRLRHQVAMKQDDHLHDGEKKSKSNAAPSKSKQSSSLPKKSKSTPIPPKKTATTPSASLKKAKPTAVAPRLTKRTGRTKKLASKPIKVNGAR